MKVGGPQYKNLKKWGPPFLRLCQYVHSSIQFSNTQQWSLIIILHMYCTVEFAPCVGQFAHTFWSQRGLLGGGYKLESIIYSYCIPQIPQTARTCSTGAELARMAMCLMSHFAHPVQIQIQSPCAASILSPCPTLHCPSGWGPDPGNSYRRKNWLAAVQISQILPWMHSNCKLTLLLQHGHLE